MFYDWTEWGGSKAWCSLTSNYDKDKKWGYCNSVDTTECKGEIHRFKLQYPNLLLEKIIFERSAISVLFEKYFPKVWNQKVQMFSLIVINFENIQHFDTESIWYKK